MVTSSMSLLSIVFLDLSMIIGVCFGYGWTTDDLSLFDLVEEINQNFYVVFGIEQDASLGEIKKAYRKLSLQWHPDRNKEANAEEKFRQIAGIYEILKTETGRRKYSEILQNGLPDWRQPIYYYRHARKMPCWESLLLLLLISTLGHYLVVWAAYFERRLALSENIGNRLKKKEKWLRRKHNVEVDDVIEEEVQRQLVSCRPRWTNLLPLQMLSASYCLLIALCQQYKSWRREEQVIEDSAGRSQPIYIRNNHPPRIDSIEYELATDLKPVTTVDQNAMHKFLQEAGNEDDSLLTSAEEEWSVDELSLLARLSAQKYPVGTVNRWEKMARILNRPVQSVTAMMGKLKHMDRQDLHRLEPIAQYEQRKNSGENGVWAQNQQKLLEQALQQFPKGAAERWDNISTCVPGKTKEECMTRYKQLAEMVRQRKSKNSH